MYDGIDLYLKDLLEVIVYKQYCAINSQSYARTSSYCFTCLLSPCCCGVATPLSSRSAPLPLLLKASLRTAPRSSLREPMRRAWL